jgi:hypothetical protein
MKAEEQIIIEASQKAHQQLLEALMQINNLFEALKQYKLPDAAKAGDEATTGVRRLPRGHIFDGSTHECPTTLSWDG